MENKFQKNFCMNENLYWIGPRESDIVAVKNLFAGSITFFGDGGVDGYAENAPTECRGNRSLSRQLKVDHNNLGDRSLDDFVESQVKEILELDKNAKFYMYNPNVIRSQLRTNDKFYRAHYVCLNNPDTMEALDSKIQFHNIFAEEFGKDDLLEIQQLQGKVIDSYHELCQRFEVDPFSGIRFIVQEEFSSGGAGTHVVARPRHGERLSFSTNDKEKNDNYLCSILQENNVSVNAHIIIFKDEILLLPPSIQIIRENNKRLMYRGADFIAYQGISEKLRKRFEQLCIKAAKKFKDGFVSNGQKYESYYGILGLDAIIHKGKVKILECNNRFQSSSNLLNYALGDYGLPCLQEMNYCAFNGKFSDCLPIEKYGDKLQILNVDDDEELRYVKLNVPVKYSNFNFVDSGSNVMHAKRMFAIADYYLNGKKSDKKNYGFVANPEVAKKNACLYALEKDGYNPDYSYKAFAHLFRISFNSNIACIDPEGMLRLSENICETDKGWSDKIYDFDPLATKVSLLMQGVVIDESEQTQELLREAGNFRAATNDAIDLKLNRPITVSAPMYTELVVNAPLSIKYSAFSPYSLRAQDGRFCLYYYSQKINDNIEIFPEDALAKKQINGVNYSDVAFLSGDRLRVHITNHCRFKKGDVGCKFCNMTCEEGKARDYFDLEIVRTVVKDYLDRANGAEGNKFRINHFLVGGQSPSEEISQEKLIATIKLLHELAPLKKIYVMALPPKHKKEILDLVKAGASEFAFNIEVFNEDVAKQLMPGKAAARSREEYIRALNAARFILDEKENDNVRTMFVVGLEPTISFKQGLRLMIDNGIQPMLSIFRPLLETEMSDFLPPSLQEVYDLYLEAEKWCEEKNLHLGPKCRYCQNNTLSLPY